MCCNKIQRLIVQAVRTNRYFVSCVLIRGENQVSTIVLRSWWMAYSLQKEVSLLFFVAIMTLWVEMLAGPQCESQRVNYTFAVTVIWSHSLVLGEQRLLMVQWLCLVSVLNLHLLLLANLVVDSVVLLEASTAQSSQCRVLICLFIIQKLAYILMNS